ncbi:AGAP005665-PA-like protein [Anopheles sinensis]|uniref:AGAP005665-PA-like protein n=1 Tax=Anopheles sinensis TaxID=74873 RepID=A0A084W488_ANOSI|nr:AGAP005665-PA-like protein [Anopheles sinensis]
MKTFALLVGLLAVASAEWIDIDWSKVRPIEEFDHYWAPHNRNVQEPEQQRIRFSTAGIISHPQYTPTNIRNDVAVVRLDSPITFNARVQPARLPARSDTRQFGGVMGTVSGFGRTSDATQATSAVVMYTTNPVMTNADCIAQWNTVVIQPQNVCMSGANGRSACNGDSGGPLAVQDGGSLQIGIVSFGSAAGCSIGMPSVYARVSFFLDFIEANSDFVASP